MFDDLFAHEAFALIRMRGAETVTLLAGQRIDLASLADIPLASTGESGWESLVLVPFAQVQERGFVAHQDGTPLSVIRADVRREVALSDVLAALPDVPVEFVDGAPNGFETSDTDYAGARAASVKAAGEIFGAKAKEVRAVEAAWAAVNVTSAAEDRGGF